MMFYVWFDGRMIGWVIAETEPEAMEMARLQWPRLEVDVAASKLRGLRVERRRI
jgi:hypothetical protein